MKIILDECVPALVRTQLSHYDIVTVQYRGWDGIKNGELLRRVAAEFDVFISSDKNLPRQQNLSELDVSILLLPSNQVPAVRDLLPKIDAALLEPLPEVIWSRSNSIVVTSSLSPI